MGANESVFFGRVRFRQSKPSSSAKSQTKESEGAKEEDVLPSRGTSSWELSTSRPEDLKSRAGDMEGGGHN